MLKGRIRFVAGLILCFLLCSGYEKVTGKPGVAVDEVHKFDQFGRISRAEERARLRVFATALKSGPNVRGHIVVYAGQPTGLRTAVVRARELLSYLVNSCGVNRDRIISIALDGNQEDRFSIQLWAFPDEASASGYLLGTTANRRSETITIIKGTEVINRRRAPRK